MTNADYQRGYQDSYRDEQEERDRWKRHAEAQIAEAQARIAERNHQEEP